MTVRVSDHALLRVIERGGGFDVEGLRRAVSLSLERGVAAADRLGQTEVRVRIGRLVYVVKDGSLVTVLFAGGERR